jgi:hypothetical protein
MPHALRSLLFVSLWLGALLSGCGDDSEPDGGPAECTVPVGSGVTPGCESCARGSCSGELSDFCSSGCSRTDTSAACQQAIGRLAACVLSGCAKECEAIAGGGSDGGGGAPGASEPGFACYVEDQALCSAAVVDASTRETYERACTEAGGAVREACPTQGLLGCCSYAGGIQTCVYEATAPPLERDSCNESGGSWGEPS